jgi:large subunit ribosomal protein L6
MSRLGIKPVEIPSGVTVAVAGARVQVKGKLGELTIELPGTIRAQAGDGRLTVTRGDDARLSRSCHGLMRSLLKNMMEGVSKGFRKDLEIQGVGFKAAVQGQKLTMSLGRAAPVEYRIPEGVKVTAEEGVRLAVSGPDKQLVGDVAARIRSFYPAEPYKGKGIRFKGEHVRRKVGKTVA